MNTKNPTPEEIASMKSRLAALGARAAGQAARFDRAEAVASKAPEPDEPSPSPQELAARADAKKSDGYGFTPAEAGASALQKDPASKAPEATAVEESNEDTPALDEGTPAGKAEAALRRRRARQQEDEAAETPLTPEAWLARIGHDDEVDPGDAAYMGAVLDPAEWIEVRRPEVTDYESAGRTWDVLTGRMITTFRRRRPEDGDAEWVFEKPRYKHQEDPEKNKPKRETVGDTFNRMLNGHRDWIGARRFNTSDPHAFDAPKEEEPRGWLNDRRGCR